MNLSSDLLANSIMLVWNLLLLGVGSPLCGLLVFTLVFNPHVVLLVRLVEEGLLVDAD